jgi:hypothetical protein
MSSGRYSHPGGAFVTGICKSEKRGYWTMASARAVAKTMKRLKGGKGLHAYDCPYCDYFHIGHHVDGVIKGRITKSAAYPRRRQGDP